MANLFLQFSKSEILEWDKPSDFQQWCWKIFNTLGLEEYQEIDFYTLETQTN